MTIKYRKFKASDGLLKDMDFFNERNTLEERKELIKEAVDNGIIEIDDVSNLWVDEISPATNIAFCKEEDTILIS